MAKKSIGGAIRDISNEVQDERMSQALAGDEFEAGSMKSYVIQHSRLLRIISEDMDESLKAGTLRDKMKKASAICQRVMLLIDTAARSQ